MAGNRWNRNQDVKKKTEEELFVFGYSCKIFRDDEKASYIDQGKHMIPWMGDESLMIDRYDVRGYLHDLSAFDTPYEEEDISDEEKLCEEERYLALRSNLTEEELYQEEELKRLRAAVASDGAYHEISFSYENIEDSNSEQVQDSVKEEAVDEPYQVPAGLNVPKGMPTPSNMKIHAIIQKTALFISRQGGQMEIIIKMKQNDNPQFAFMNLDNPLYPYYKHVVQEIKTGRYKPPPEVKKKEPEDDHDGHYLHPSLVSGIPQDVPEFTVPSINFVRTGDDSYSLLVKNLKACIEEDALRNSPTVEQTDSPLVTDEESNSAVKQLSKPEEKASPEDSLSDTDDSLSDSGDSDSETVVPPPPNMQPVIDKMAEYVAKNGEDFETIVKGKRDKRFEFLQPGSKFYNYYVFRRNTVMKAIALSLAKSEKTAEESPSTVAQSQADIAKESNNASPDASASTQSSPEEEKMPSGTNSVSPAEEESSDSDEDSSNEDTTQESKSENCQPVVPPPSLPPPCKVMKGPISFSLKMKECEAGGLEKSKKASLLLDDFDPEEEEDTETNPDTERKSKATASETTNNNVSRKPSSPAENEDKPKKMSAEEMEQKMAEEKIKDKLMAAARERLVQHKKDKQLQQERKQKAALFLQMLQKKKDSGDTQATDNIGSNGNTSVSPTTSEITSPERAIPISSYPPSPLSATKMLDDARPSSPSSSDSSVKNKSSEAKANEHIGSSDNATKKKKSKTRSASGERKHSSGKSKSHKHGHSKKRKRSRSRSKSPSHKHKHLLLLKSRKEKKLPAAYANNRRSRSRSRSPRRYAAHGRSRSPLLYRSRWRQ